MLKAITKYFLIFVLCIPVASFTQTTAKFPTENQIYDFMNLIHQGGSKEKVFVRPARFQWDTLSMTDTFIKGRYKDNSQLSNMQNFLWRIEKEDKFGYLKQRDYDYIVRQIKYPVVSKWNKKKYTTDKIVLWSNIFRYAVNRAVPLFSVDGLTAITYTNYWGMSRVGVYRFNRKLNEWEYIFGWQDGS